MSRNLSRKLASVGYGVTNAENLLPLVQYGSFERVCELVYEVRSQQVLLDNACVAASRIANLVKALKLYAHSDHEALTESSFKDDINNTLTILHNKIKTGVVVRKEFSDIPVVLCHADELNQVWTNIINNAIQAMGGVGVLVIRLYEESNEQVVVEFEDNGPGIAKNSIDKIFDPYFTTKKRGDGTGLGLSICKKIIDKHDATISVDSVPGKTVFKITVPVSGVEQNETTFREQV
jgi:signal transduction histidine kinase